MLSSGDSSRARNFLWEDYRGEVRGRKSPVESKGEVPVEGPGDEVPQKLKQFEDIVYIFYCRNDQKLTIVVYLTPDY